MAKQDADPESSLEKGREMPDSCGFVSVLCVCLCVLDGETILVHLLDGWKPLGCLHFVYFMVFFSMQYAVVCQITVLWKILVCYCFVQCYFMTHLVWVMAGRYRLFNIL